MIHYVQKESFHRSIPIEVLQVPGSGRFIHQRIQGGRSGHAPQKPERGNNISFGPTENIIKVMLLACPMNILSLVR